MYACVHVHIKGRSQIRFFSSGTVYLAFSNMASFIGSELRGLCWPARKPRGYTISSSLELNFQAFAIFLKNFCFCFVFQDKASLCNLECPGTCSVDLELRDPPDSASRILGLKVSSTTTQHPTLVCKNVFW